MRRRLQAGEPPEELKSFTAWGAVCNVFVAQDLRPLKLRTLADKRAATRDRWECYREWKQARARFAQQHGWPGGEMRREAEEGRVWVGAPWPDESAI